VEGEIQVVRAAPRLTVVRCSVLLALGIGASGVDAQEVAPVTVDLMLTTATIDRTASALSTAAAALSRGTDLAMKSALGERVRPTSRTAITLRLAKLLFLDVPITHFVAGLNHEFGHMAWARQDGARLAFHLNGGPWSSNVFDLRCNEPDAPLGLGTYGGGFDAEFLLERRTWDRVQQDGRSSVNDAVFLLDGAVGRFYYIHQSLSQVTGRMYDDLLYKTGDPTRYVYQLVQQRGVVFTRDSILAAATSVRRRAWLNFADFALWGQAINLVRHVASGKDAFETRYMNVGSVGLGPFARYGLSPAGPQTEVGTRYRLGRNVGDVSMRWTEPAGNAPLLGTSLAWARTGGAVVNPHVRVDFWRDVTRKNGVRVESGITATRWPSPRAGLRLTVGVKTAGYVIGLPRQATAYAETGLRVRF
jgi:hypothetical protein